MANFNKHYTIVYATNVLKHINNLNFISSVDKITIQHIVTKKVNDFGLVKLIDTVLCKYVDNFNAIGVPYVSIANRDNEQEVVRKVSSEMLFKIINNNILEVYVPFLPNYIIKPLTEFFKTLGFEFDVKKERWVKIIHDENVLYEIENNQHVMSIGYSYEILSKRDTLIKNCKRVIDLHEDALDMSFKAELENSDFAGMFDKLFPFQQVTLKYSDTHKNIFICDDMGLGKTLQGIAVAEYHNAFPAVIVCPANLIEGWTREIKKWLPNRTVCKLQDRSLLHPADFYIVSYNGVLNYGTRLRFRKPKIVLVDESHNIKSSNAKRTKRLFEYFKSVDRKILITGTPILNRTIEIVTQLDFLGVLDKHFGGKTRFMNRYCPAISTGMYTKYGDKNSNELQIELRKSCMVRREKSDVLSELPDIMRQMVFLPLDNYDKYKEVELDSINWFRQTLIDNTDLDYDEIEAEVAKKEYYKNIYAEKIVKTNYLKQAAIKYKMPAVFEWIDNALEQVDKLVIFGYHRKTIEQLYERYSDSAVMLYGGMAKQADNIVSEFIDNPNKKLFIGSLKAANTGLDRLQNVCDKMAFVELGWNPAIHNQAEARIHRIGQLSNFVNIYYLIASGTIEEYIYDLIIDKQINIENATNINKVFDLIAA